jgi:hypothetical protein
MCVGIFLPTELSQAEKKKEFYSLRYVMNIIRVLTEWSSYELE